MQIQWKWTIPNVLSLLRMAILPLFVVLYVKGQTVWACVTLAVSGISDVLDGIVARRLHQITDIGKLLDPIADKLTQFVVLVCVAIRNPIVWLLVVACLGKEICQLIGFVILFKGENNVRMSMWFGKLYTAMFYVVIGLMVLADLIKWKMPWWLSVPLVVLMLLMTLFAFFNYLHTYIEARKTMKKSEEEAA